MRRIATVILVTAALALAAIPALASHSISVTYTGPVTPGEDLRLDCPEGFALVAGNADFYRDRAMRVSVALDVPPTEYVLWPHGGAYMAYVWTVPRGARFADVFIECSELPPTTSFVKEGISDGSVVTFLCPSTHPYLVDAVVYGDEDANFDTFPQYFVFYQVQRDPDGISFLPAIGHGYRAIITCTSETPPPTTGPTTTNVPTTTFAPTTTTVVPTSTTTPPSTTATTTVPTTSTTVVPTTATTTVPTTSTTTTRL